MLPEGSRSFYFLGQGWRSPWVRRDVEDLESLPKAAQLHTAFSCRQDFNTACAIPRESCVWLKTRVVAAKEEQGFGA